MSHTRKLRKMAAPFVVAPPGGARVRTRLMVDDTDQVVLEALGAHLGHLASADLARRVKEGSLDAKAKAESRKARKQQLTAASSSRWAGAITRTTEDAYSLARRNLAAEKVSLQARIKKISSRVKVPAGEKMGRVCGYGTFEERWEKQRRLQVLSSRLGEVDAQLESGHLSICRGGKRLAKNRHNLEAAGQTYEQWREEWTSARWFITADGEADKTWGNETIRWHPGERWLEIKLPAPLAHLANRPYGRWRLSCPVAWPYRGDEVAAQATSGALRYDISYDPSKARWYIDASWKAAATAIASLEQLRRGPVVAVDLNVAHLAVSVLDRYGNVLGSPSTIPLVLDGLPTSTRDGHIRAAISQILEIAAAHQAGAVVIEHLDFAAARTEGREKTGNRPSRGRRAKRFRRHISGLPTAKLRDRLTQMAYNAQVAVIAVDPAYTSKWGAEHWLSPLKVQHPQGSLTGHHAAAVVIGRRGLGQRARRRGMCARSSPEDGERATVQVSAGWPEPAIAAGLPEPPSTRQPAPGTGRRQPPKARTRRAPNGGSKTAVPTGSEGRQVAQDRSGPPIGRCSQSRSV